LFLIVLWEETVADDTSPSYTSTGDVAYLNAEWIDIDRDVVGRDKITAGYISEQVSASPTPISTKFQPKPSV
jgi:hypothetical protein